MANNYYNFTTPFIPGTKVRSEQVNSNLGGVESGFDLLPTDPVSSIIGTSWFGTEAQGATVNEYQVTSPDPQTSLTEGQRTAFRATHTNDGPVTLDVDGTGLVAAVNFSGTAMSASTLVSGRYYEFIYDSTNTQWILTAAIDAANQVSYAEEWANNPVGTLVSAAAGGDQVDDYSALHWSVAADNWATRAEDDPIPVIFGGDGVTDFSAFHWAQKSQASSGVPPSTVNGEFLIGDGSVFNANGAGFTFVSPVFEIAAGQARIVLDETDGGGDARLQLTDTTTADGGAAVLFDGVVGRLALQQTDDSGNLEDLWVNMQRNGAVQLYHNGLQQFATNVNGVVLTSTGGSSLYLAEKASAAADIVDHGQVFVREGAAGDALFSSVELLAEFEGADGATSYTEISNNGFTTVFNGNAQIDTAQFNSRASSLLLDGTGDWASYADNAAWDLGSGDWIIEGFVRFNSLPPLQTSAGPGYVLFSMIGATDDVITYAIIQDAFGFRVRITGDSMAEVGTISGGISTGVWYHWAVARTAGDRIYAYFNGNFEVSDGAVISGDMGGPNQDVRIGSYDGASAFHDGWIDDVRVTIGNNRGLTGFGSYTIPTTPYATTAGEHDLVFRTDQGSEFVLGGGSGNRVTGDINTATPPTTEAITALLTYTDLAGDDTIATLGFNGSNQLNLRNFMQGGNFQLDLVDTSGNTRNPIQVDPDDYVRLEYPGFSPKKKTLGDLRRLETANSGIDVFGSADFDGDPTLGESQDTAIYLRNNSGQLVGEFAFNASGALEIYNDVYESRIDLYTTDDAGGSIAQMELSFGAGITFFTHSGGRSMQLVETNDKKDQTMRLNMTGADDGNTAGQDTAIGFVDNILTPVDRAVVGFESTDNFVVRSAVGEVWLQDDNGNGFPCFVAGQDGIAIFSGDTGVTQTRIEWRDLSGFTLGTRNAYIGPVGSNQFDIVNELNGRPIRIASNDSGGTLRSILLADPNSTTVLRADTVLSLQSGAGTLGVQLSAAGVTSLYNGGAERLRTGSTGSRNIGNATNTSVFELANSGGSTLTRIGHTTSDTCEIENTITNPGVAFRFVGEDSGTITRTMMEMNPNTGPSMFESGVEVARVVTAANGGWEVNNTETGSGFERVLTESDVPGTNPAQRFVKTANETVVSSTTYQNDDHLVSMAIPVGRWSYTGTFRSQATVATSGFKFRWTNSGGAFDGDRSYIFTYRADTGASPSNADTYYTTLDGVVGAQIVTTNTNEQFGFLSGHVGIITATKTFTTQWAQVVAGGNTVFYENSNMKWDPLD